MLIKSLVSVLIQRQLLHFFLIILACMAVYLNTLHVPFIMDDEHIAAIGQKDILDILFHGGSRRVVDLTFFLNYRLHGLQVTGYHLVNILIHILASLTLYCVVDSILAAMRRLYTPPTTHTSEVETALTACFIPLVVALLFAVHPMQTQAVTYTIQRYASLSTFFYLMSVLFFLKSRLKIETCHSKCTPWLLAIATVLTGLLAVCSKQIAFTLPLMLFCLEIILFRGQLINRKFWIICGALSSLVLVAVLFVWSEGSLEYFLYDLQQATSEDSQIPRTTYFLTETRVVVKYLRLLLLPYGQSLIHFSPLYSEFFSVPVITSVSLHLFIVAVAVLLFNRSEHNLTSKNNVAKGGLQRLTALGVVWFYIAILIESSIFPISDVIFEHRVYLPSAGFFIAVTAGFALFLNSNRIRSRWFFVPLLFICIVLGSLTIARNEVWRDALTLYEDTVLKAPNSVLALANLGDEYLLRNMPEKAVPYFVKALELKPNLDAYTKVYLGESLHLLNIYNARFTTGKEFILPVGGVRDYRFESVIFNNIGLAYEYLGNKARAEKFYRKSLMINPEYDLAWFNLGLISISLRDKEQFAISMSELQRINPVLAKQLASYGR